MKNDFYVYSHQLKDGTVFYVGKGRGRRAYDVRNRCKAWKEIVKTNEYNVVFHKTNLLENEALDYELSLFSTYPDIVNVRTSNRHSEIDIEMLKEYVQYSETSPTGLIWKVNRYCGNYCRLSHEIGSPVGSINKRKDGHIAGWNCSINKNRLLAHRVIYSICVGPIPDGMVVNHIDNNPLNNRLENLELCSVSENNRRTKFHKTDSEARKTKTGIAGVSFDSIRQRFVAYYYLPDNGKMVRTHFNISKYDTEDQAFQAACNWRNERIAELNLQGAGYTDRHGT